MDEQFFRFVDESKATLEAKKPELEKQLTAIVNYLQNELIDKVNLRNITINGRVKGTLSLREKIIRKNYYIKYTDPETFINELPDIIGIRIVCLLNDEELQVYAKLKELFCNRDPNIDNYLCLVNSDESSRFLVKDEHQPQFQKNGNSIYRLTCKWFDKDRNSFINIELQIKSLVHFFWGELEHMLFYKNYSYNIAGDFYENHMKLIEKDLSTIDTQLSLLKNHLMKNEEAKIKEIKQIAALMLSSAYSSKISNYLQCEIDLREIYDLIVDMHFYRNKADSEIINRLNQILEKTNATLNLTEQTPACFSPELEVIKNGKYIGEDIYNCISSPDVFWKMFYLLYKSIYEISEHDKVICNISKNLIGLFSQFEDDLAEFSDFGSEDDKIEVIKDAIYKGISKTFNRHRKMDFFLYQVYLKNMLRFISDFIQYFSHIIEGANAAELRDNSELFVEYIYVVLSSITGEGLLAAELSTLVKLAEENNILDVKIESDELQRLIKDQKKLSELEVKSCLGFGGEGN